MVLLPLILLSEYRLNPSFKQFINRFITMAVFAGGMFFFLLLVFYSVYGW